VKRISILLVVLLALVVAACSSDQSNPSASADESDAPASVAATPEASEPEASETEPDGTTGALPSFDLNGDPELAARFPDTVGGEPLQVQSFRGDVFMSTGGTDPAFEEFLDSVGADLEDVSVAFGGSADPSGESFLSVGAFRVLGASEDDLEREFISASEEAGDISGLEQANIGGKDVWTAEDPSGETETRVYLYTKDDTVYFLTGTEAQITEIMEALP
jgi:hypothetical protein